MRLAVLRTPKFELNVLIIDTTTIMERCHKNGALKVY